MNNTWILWKILDTIDLNKIINEKSGSCSCMEMSTHSVFYGQNKCVCFRIHTPLHLPPPGVHRLPGSVRSRWPCKELCLPTAWHLIEGRAQSASPAWGHAPDLCIRPDHQNGVRPVALTSLFHSPILLTPSPSSAPTRRHICVSAKPFSDMWNEVGGCCSDRLGTVFVRIFMVMGLVFLLRTAFERADATAALLLKHLFEVRGSRICSRRISWVLNIVHSHFFCFFSWSLTLKQRSCLSGKRINMQILFGKKRNERSAVVW